MAFSVKVVEALKMTPLIGMSLTTTAYKTMIKLPKYGSDGIFVTIRYLVRSLGWNISKKFFEYLIGNEHLVLLCIYFFSNEPRASF